MWLIYASRSHWNNDLLVSVSPLPTHPRRFCLLTVPLSNTAGWCLAPLDCIFHTILLLFIPSPLFKHLTSLITFSTSLYSHLPLRHCRPKGVCVNDQKRPRIRCQIEPGSPIVNSRLLENVFICCWLSSHLHTRLYKHMTQQSFMGLKSQLYGFCAFQMSLMWFESQCCRVAENKQIWSGSDHWWCRRLLENATCAGGLSSMEERLTSLK